MSAYPPPTETLPIFNVNEFIGTTNTSQGGGGGGGGTYVNYPTAQGFLNLVGFQSSSTATLTNMVVNGTSDINNNINLSGDLVLDGVNASINFLNGTIQTSAYTGLTSSAGTYPDANLTIDANGKITAISAGTGSSILTSNNIFSGTNTFINTVDISGTTLNIADNSILECNEATVNIGDGGSGQLTIECPISIGGFGDITMLNSDIIMTDDAVITQGGTRTTPNTLFTTDIISGSHIQYNSDNTQQTSAFTGAGALAGSYTNTNMTVDANGKITALANGSGGTNLLPLNNTWTGLNNFTLTTTLSTATFADSTSQTSAFTGAGALTGSYTNTNMTVDANGRITALANGSGASNPKPYFWATGNGITISYPTTINIQNSTFGSWNINMFYTLRLNLVVFYNGGSSVYTLDTMIDIYPQRVVGTISIPLNSQVINIATNTINGNATFFMTDPTYAPNGRWFWSHQITSTGNMNAGWVQLYIAGSGIVGVQITNPNGFFSGGAYSVSIMTEIVSQGAGASGVWSYNNLDALSSYQFVGSG